VNSIHATISDSGLVAASCLSPIHVVATTMAGTRAAIATASALAEGLDAHVHVIAARPTPREWPLDQQAAPVRAFAKEIRQFIEGSQGRIDVLPCVCRRLMDVIELLPRGAMVVIAGRSHRWWPTREQRLAHALNELGYRVMFIHTSDRSPVAAGRGGK
jgi:hypothetical protein